MTSWFGEPWPSFVCFDESDRLIKEAREAFPAGESCLLCGEEFDEAAGDSGTAVVDATAEPAQVRHVHKECSLMNVVGPLAHHEGHCELHGDGTGTSLTHRQEALEVWRRNKEGTLYGH